jgi:hypothetical protein
MDFLRDGWKLGRFATETLFSVLRKRATGLSHSCIFYIYLSNSRLKSHGLLSLHVLIYEFSLMTHWIVLFVFNQTHLLHNFWLKSSWGHLSKPTILSRKLIFLKCPKWIDGLKKTEAVAARNQLRNDLQSIT